MSVALSTRGVIAPSGSSGGGGGGDGPTIAIVSPTPDTTPGDPGGFSDDWAIARLTPIVLEITDLDPGNLYQCLVCRYAGGTSETVIYRRGAFRGEFAGSSSVLAIADGLRFSILPINGWPSSDALNDIEFEIDAIDGSGNLAA